MRKAKRILVCLMMAVLVSVGVLPNSTVLAARKIPAGAKQYKGHYYYAYDDASSWEDARAKCKSRGGYLATITSAKENKVVFQAFRASGASWAYFGLYRQNPESNHWKWITGEKVSYTKWTPGQPDNLNGYGELYGCMYRENNGTWDDGIRGVSGYICEWDGYHIQINEKSLKMKPGESEYLQYTIEDINGKKVSKKASWKSSNVKVAKVSSKGKVVAVNPGACSITCKAGNSKKTVKVLVLPKRVAIQSVISQNSQSVQLKWKKQAGVTGYMVYRYDPDLGEFTKIKTVKGNFNTATIRGLKRGTTHSFKVRAYIKSGSKNYYGDYSKAYKVKTKK